MGKGKLTKAAYAARFHSRGPKQQVTHHGPPGKPAEAFGEPNASLGAKRVKKVTAADMDAVAAEILNSDVVIPFRLQLPDDSKE